MTSLSLWELGDEMHDRAEELLPLCDLQVLHPVIEFNRGLNWFWWTAALLEVGEYEQAEQLLRDRTEDLLVELPDSWAFELRISRLARLILMRAAGQDEVEELRELGAPLPRRRRRPELAASDAGLPRTRPRRPPGPEVRRGHHATPTPPESSPASTGPRISGHSLNGPRC